MIEAERRFPVQFESLTTALPFAVMSKTTAEVVPGHNFLRAFSITMTCLHRAASCAIKSITSEAKHQVIKVLAIEIFPRIVDKNDEKRNTDGINVTESNTSLNYESRMFVSNNGETDAKEMAGTKCSMMSRHYEKLSTSQKRSRRKPRNKK
uniref:Uncharacterized protein n=1 Tax=Glossina palpalis gambiensis TaxID=67801 RepID=A0A1B0BZG9_9MUSC